MEEAKKLLGAVTISPKIIAEVEAEVKDIGEFKKKIEAYTRANIRDVTDQTAQCLMDDLFSNPPSMFPLFFVRRETERTVVQKIV